MHLVYVVYSKSKIHGIYSDNEVAQDVLQFLHDKAGYNNGVPKKFYYIDTLEIDKIPDKMKLN